MKKKQDEVVMFDSPEAAQEVTLTGWKSRKGYFFYGPQAEKDARDDGCTHKICECGSAMEKHWLHCSSCRDKKAEERYLAREFVEWDGQTPLYCDCYDRYFRDEDEIGDAIAFGEIDFNSLRLLVCEYDSEWTPLNTDHFENDLADGEDLPHEIGDLVNEFNMKLREIPKNVWSLGKKRTSVTAEQIGLEVQK